VVASYFEEFPVSSPWTNLSDSARTSYNGTYDNAGQNIGTLIEDIILTPPNCYPNCTPASTRNADCQYGVDAVTHRALQNYLMGDSNTTCFLTGNVITDPQSNGSEWLYSTYAANVMVSPCTSANEDNCTSDFYDFFEYTISNVTYYMTNNLQRL
jgi:hypothetical protein